MTISDEQARLASSTPSGDPRHADERDNVPTELVDRVREAVMRCPDTRAECVAEARVHLARGIDAYAIADRMVSSIVGARCR